MKFKLLILWNQVLNHVSWFFHIFPITTRAGSFLNYFFCLTLDITYLYLKYDPFIIIFLFKYDTSYQFPCLFFPLVDKRDIRKVRKRQHQYPEFAHTQGEVKKKPAKKYIRIQWGWNSENHQIFLSFTLSFFFPKPLHCYHIDFTARTCLL
jgi:hypothetical protein